MPASSVSPASPFFLWLPRVLGLLVSLFLGLFALDAFGEGKPVGEAVADFLVHLLPVFGLLGVVALSWRWEWVGGVIFTALAGFYAWYARPHPSWIPPISGPLLLVGLLFLVSWGRRRRMAAKG